MAELARHSGHLWSQPQAAALSSGSSPSSFLRGLLLAALVLLVLRLLEEAMHERDQERAFRATSY